MGLANGSVIAARAMVRLVPSLRWSMEKFGAVKGAPMDFKTKEYDIIEEDIAPHTHPEVDEEQDLKASNRRL